jgi:hypothetical protein
LSPKGEFSNRPERALDLSKNVLDQAKRDLGNSPYTLDIFLAPCFCSGQFCQMCTACCPNKNSFERSLKRFLLINLGEAEDQRFELCDLNCLSPKGEFSNRLERALDLSKNVLDQAKRDLGNSLCRSDTLVFFSRLDKFMPMSLL